MQDYLLCLCSVYRPCVFVLLFVQFMVRPTSIVLFISNLGATEVQLDEYLTFDCKVTSSNLGQEGGIVSIVSDLYTVPVVLEEMQNRGSDSIAYWLWLNRLNTFHFPMFVFNCFAMRLSLEQSELILSIMVLKSSDMYRLIKMKGCYSRIYFHVLD